jgi:hypothetical protein
MAAGREFRRFEGPASTRRFDQQPLVATSQGDLKQEQITRHVEEKLLESHLDSELDARLAIAKWERHA